MILLMIRPSEEHERHNEVMGAVKSTNLRNICKMSKLIIAVLITFWGYKAFHYSRVSGQNNPLTSDVYKIVEIDSLRNYYLIYAQRSDSLFKIVSKKAQNNDSFCERIKTGLSYRFSLNSMSVINGRPITPSASTYEVSGIAVDDTTYVLFDTRSHWDLYYTNDLSGLCRKE